MNRLKVNVLEADIVTEPTVISLGGRNDASVKFVDRKALDAAC